MRHIYTRYKPGETHGALLRRARNRSGRTQDELAILLGVSRVTLSRWEHDRNGITMQRMRDVATAYGVHDLDLARAAAGTARKAAQR